MNSVCLLGNLVKDAELTKGVLNFSVAVNEAKKTEKGEYENYANYFDCVMFGPRAEAIAKYLEKGKKVAINGKLHQSRWEAKEGGKKSKVEIVVNDIDLLTPKESGKKDEDVPF